MKKFNTKTLLIGILIVIGLFVIVFTAFGQKAYGQKVLDPPTDLYATVEGENDVNLFWTAPSAGGSTYLNWDSGENEDSFGNFLGPYIMTFASKYDPVHIEAYDGWEIKKLRFWIISPLAEVKLKVMTGPDATEIYSQDVQSFNLNAWTEIDLTTPVTIDASQELWFGLYIDMPVAGPVMGTDSGPAIDGYGNMYYFQGTWWSDFNLNWNLQAFIESPSDNLRESLLGYNIYRDDVKINDNTHGSTSYVDENLLNGSYDYYVTAVYDDGESVPSNEIEVQISQPVIAYQDSMALVDLYNNCDGPNWLINTLWLEGPVSEWAGVVTTGTRVTQLWLQSKGLTGAVPESIGDLTALKKMVLTTNPITSIPETIGNLSSLEMLWIGWTDITSVPESIGNLTNLNELHLGLMNNPLTSLPESFCNLESLEWLALGGNALTSLPSCFGNLSSLETLFIWGNQLTELPESFGNLQSLWHLNMDDNPITHLPVNFGDLDNLESMRMEGNLLTALPESFSDLENLEIVWGRGNQIEALPEAFGNLDSLTFINLSSNVITEFPASITDLASIRELLFDNNEIAYIPEDIGNLSTLKVLGLIGNNIPSVPESIGDLSALRILGLASNNIPSLPESFGYLTADSIYLNNNLLHELPSTMLDNQYDFLLTYSNFLQFGSVEPFIGNVEYFYAYAPQGLIGNDTLVEVLDGQDLNYTLEVTGENNVYQWYKDSVMIQGQNTNTLTLSSVDENDEGLYYLEVTNTLATDLILTSHLIEVVIGDCVPWTFIVTGSVHSITIPATADVAINGEPLQTGDWIGAFYLNDEGEEVCGGAGKWGGLFGGAGALVNAYGDDPTTNEKDGFADGENFRWKMYSCSNAEEYTASASYDPDMPNQGYFADLGTSKLTSLNNAYCQYFDMPEGWSSVSSYVVPENPAVEEIMAPVVNDLILMRNLNQLYWPEEELNTIGDWDNASGYATKFVNEASFEICGGEMADENLLINEGWSYLPVPSACDVDVNQLFGDHLDDIVIVQDLIGTQVFWPALGIYTLENLIPGKAYKIKTNNAINVTFPACENKTPSYTSRNNRLVTPWGDFNMTPSSENVVVFAEAITNLMAGDVIAAFNEYDRVCGMMEITNTKQNHSLVLFGDDPTTTKVDGFTEAALVSYKLYRMSTGEEFALNVEYSASFENTTGLYYSGSLAGITNMTTGITSVDEINNIDVKLYPNPANTVVNVKLPSTIDGSANVEIISLQGKTVLHQRIDAGAGMIDISHLEAGVYMVKISSYSFTKIEKLILQ